MENNATKINEKLRELTDEELAQVSGGAFPGPGFELPGNGYDAYFTTEHIPS